MKLFFLQKVNLIYFELSSLSSSFASDFLTQD